MCLLGRHLGRTLGYPEPSGARGIQDFFSRVAIHADSMELTSPSIQEGGEVSVWPFPSGDFARTPAGHGSDIPQRCRPVSFRSVSF